MRIIIEKKKSVSFVHIYGDFNINSVVDFEAEWDKIIETKPELVAIDCKNISFIDSTALSALVQFLKFLVGRNIKLSFFDLSNAVDRLFQASMLNKFLTITTQEKIESEYK